MTDLTEECGSCTRPWGEHGQRAPHGIPPMPLLRMSPEAALAGSICPGFWPKHAGRPWHFRPGGDPACPCEGAPLPPGGDWPHALNGMTPDEVDMQAREGRITAEQRAAYYVAWCAMGHDPRRCADLLGRVRPIGSLFHYLKPDGTREATHWPDTEAPESVLARTYGPEVAARSLATWEARYPSTRSP